MDGIEPMGVCLPGQTHKAQLFGFILFPLLFTTIFSIVFLLWTSWLIQNTIVANREATTNKNASSNIQDLSIRLAFYSIGVTCTLLLLTITAIVFYVKQDGVRISFQNYVYCEIQNILFTDVGKPTKTCVRTETMPVFWFITWVIASLTAVAAQLILSCHVSHRDRLKRVATNVGSQMKDALDKIEVSHVSSLRKKKTEQKIPQTSPRDGVVTPQNFENTSTGGNVQMQTLGMKSVVSKSEIEETSGIGDKETSGIGDKDTSNGGDKEMSNGY